MSEEAPGEGKGPDPAYDQVYTRILREAREVSAKARRRLSRLCRRFPSALPGVLADQVKRLLADPDGERRKAVRLPPGDDRAEVVWPGEGGRVAQARVVDRSPGGLALRMDRPAEAGTVLSVRREGECWELVEVRHCRADGEGWVAGFAVVGACWRTG
jgi:hypothetical protein